MLDNKGKSLATKIAKISAIALALVFGLLIVITTFLKTLDFTNSLGFLIGFYIVSLIALVIIIFNISKQTLKPLQEIVIATENLSKGNLDIRLENDSDDEIGRVSTSFNKTVITLKEIITDINYLLSEMANCNFTVSSSKENSYVGEFSKVLVSVQQIKSNLSDTLSQIEEASSQVNLGAEQVSSASQALSQGAVEQANSIEDLSVTISDIANHVNLNAENAQEASLQSNEAGSGIMESNSQMSGMISAMNDITDKSNEIGKIIKTIEDIAFQTNILALNAAVEAARAGSAGKGFAVVADEVRNLATKSAEAAKNTTLLIEQTVSAVANGSKIADDTAASLLSAVEKTSKVETLISKIAEASKEQSTSISQVTSGVDQISCVVQSNSATAEESAAASEELNAQADMLKSLVNKFIIDKESNSVHTEKEINNDFKKKKDSFTNNLNTSEKLTLKDIKPEKLEKDKPDKPDKEVKIEEEFKPIIENPKFEKNKEIENIKKEKTKDGLGQQPMIGHTTVSKAATPAGTAINDYSDKY